MADEIYDAQKGLGSLLDNISGLKVYDVVPEVLNQRQGVVALIHYLGGERITIGGSSFLGRMAIELVAMPRLSQQAATRSLLQFIAPIGNKSIEAAIEKDRTWNNTVDHGLLDPLEPVGEIEPEDYPFYETGPLMRVLMVAKFVKTVAT